MTKLNEALALEAARRLEPITWSDHVVAIMTQCGDELNDVGDPDFWFEVQKLLYAVAGTTFEAEAAAEQRAWAEVLDFPRGWKKIGPIDVAIADLKAAGASQHQIYRLRKKIAAGASLDGEVDALKDRLERGPTSPRRRPSFQEYAAVATGPKPIGRIIPATVAREQLAAPEPVELAPGVYEMPWLTAARRRWMMRRPGERQDPAWLSRVAGGR
jgi:hypothetical protein